MHEQLKLVTQESRYNEKAKSVQIVRCEVYLSMYITYNLVNIPTQ